MAPVGLARSSQSGSSLETLPHRWSQVETNTKTGRRYRSMIRARCSAATCCSSLPSLLSPSEGCVRCCAAVLQRVERILKEAQNFKPLGETWFSLSTNSFPLGRYRSCVRLSDAHESRPRQLHYPILYFSAITTQPSPCVLPACAHIVEAAARLCVRCSNLCVGVFSQVHSPLRLSSSNLAHIPSSHHPGLRYLDSSASAATPSLRRARQRTSHL